MTSSDRDNDWLAAALEKLARGDSSTLSSVLVSVGDVISIPDTNTSCRIHFLAQGRDTELRVRALAEFLLFQAVYFCIPRKRLMAAQDKDAVAGSTKSMDRLLKEARELFVTMDKSGESGEILLYTLLEMVLKVPQILCKMSLKTNTEMHVHGADGVHAKLLEQGELAVYWGESKLHSRVNSAIDECFESIAPYLIEVDRSTAHRDLLLVRDYLDAGAKEVTAALIRFFDEDDPNYSKLVFRGACLVGFDMDAYPEPWEPSGVQIRGEVKQAIEKWTSRIKSRIEDHKLVSVEIEVFCVPIPSVQIFRDRFRDLVVSP